MNYFECALWCGYALMAGYFWRVIEVSIDEARREVTNDIEDTHGIG